MSIYQSGGNDQNIRDHSNKKSMATSEAVRYYTQGLLVSGLKWIPRISRAISGDLAMSLLKRIIQITNNNNAKDKTLYSSQCRILKEAYLMKQLPFSSDPAFSACGLIRVDKIREGGGERHGY